MGKRPSAFSLGESEISLDNPWGFSDIVFISSKNPRALMVEVPGLALPLGGRIAAKHAEQLNLVQKALETIAVGNEKYKRFGEANLQENYHLYRDMLRFGGKEKNKAILQQTYSIDSADKGPVSRRRYFLSGIVRRYSHPVVSAKIASFIHRKTIALKHGLAKSL